MIDVLLIQPPVRDFYLTSKRTIPYGLCSIAAVLLREGFTVELLDCLSTPKSKTLDLPQEMGYLKRYYGTPDISPFSLFHRFKHFGYSFEHIAQVVKSREPRVVGISSLFTPYEQEVVETARKAKEAFPSCKVVVGGHHPTAWPERLMAHPWIDYVLRGEGEACFPALLRALQDGQGVESVPGIVFREKEGSVRSLSPAIVHDLDALPLPAIHLVKHSFYKRGEGGSLTVVASRGCPMPCSYCSVGEFSGIPSRRRSVSSVMAEIEEGVRQCRATFLDFEDENLSLDRSWFLDLLEKIKQRFPGQLELRAMNGLFPASLDGEVIRSMKEAGFKTLNLSLGSISKEQLKRFRRPDVAGAFENAVKIARGVGMECVGYIIVGAPEQDPKNSLEDLLYLFRHRVLCGVSVYYPSPGSFDFQGCRERDILPGHVSLMRSSAIPMDGKTERRDSITLLRLGRVLNFIKLLRDQAIDLPGPWPFSSISFPPEEKLMWGKALLGHFLYDGIIRGVTPEGKVFEHETTPFLCLSLREKLVGEKLVPAGNSPIV